MCISMYIYIYRERDTVRQCVCAEMCNKASVFVWFECIYVFKLTCDTNEK